MRSRFFTLLSITCLLLSGQVSAQSVMVIPFTKTGDDKRLIIEADACYRTIETKIKQAFLQQNFGLIDYEATVQRLENITDIMNNGSQQDLITLLVQNAAPDIYIIAEIEKLSRTGSNGKTEHRLTLNLRAHRTFDAKTKGATIPDSGWRYYSDCNSLATKLTQNKDLEGNNKLEAFVKSLLPAADELSQKGTPLSMEFFLHEDADYHYMTPLANGGILAQAISQWIQKHTVEKSTSPQASTKYIKYPSLVMQLANRPETKSSVEEIGYELLAHLSQLSPRDQTTTYFTFEITISGNNLIFRMQ